MKENVEKGSPLKKRGVRGRIIFYGVVAVVIAGMLFVHHFFLKRPVGEGPAGPAVPSERFADVWTQRKVLLLGLGDSITDGFGASESKNYFQRLHQNPSDEFEDMRGISLSSVIPNLSADNRAQSGSTSWEHMEHQIKLLPTQPVDVFGIVVITTGGNDVIHNYGRTPPEECAMYGASLEQAQPWIGNYEKRLGTMFDLISDVFPGGCEIFLGNIYDPTDGIGTARTVGLPSWQDGLKVLGEYNNVVARVAQGRDNVHLVDLHSLFMGHGLMCSCFWRSTYRSEDPHYWYGEVFEDPNDRGYDATRRAFLLEMVEVFEGHSFGMDNESTPQGLRQ